MRRSFALLFALFLLPAAAMAEGKPPELNSIIKAVSPVGQASMHKLLFHVYDIGFWSDGTGWKKPPYALSITYGMAFTAEDLVGRTRSEMRRVSTLPDNKMDQYAAQLTKLWPNIEDGDRLTAVATSPATTVFYHNGTKLGQVNDPDFAASFFGIWLSPKTSEPAIRQQLLAQ